MQIECSDKVAVILYRARESALGRGLLYVEMHDLLAAIAIDSDLSSRVAELASNRRLNEIIEVAKSNRQKNEEALK